MSDLFQLSTDLLEIAKGVASIESRMQLSQASIAMGELATENGRLRDEVQELRKELSRRKELEYRDGSYFLMRDDGTFEGPVCRRCYLAEGLVNRLRWGQSASLECSVCGTSYNPGTLGKCDPPPGVTFL